MLIRLKWFSVLFVSIPAFAQFDPEIPSVVKDYWYEEPKGIKLEAGVAFYGNTRREHGSEKYNARIRDLEARLGVELSKIFTAVVGIRAETAERNSFGIDDGLDLDQVYLQDAYFVVHLLDKGVRIDALIGQSDLRFYKDITRAANKLDSALFVFMEKKTQRVRQMSVILSDEHWRAVLTAFDSNDPELFNSTRGFVEKTLKPDSFMFRVERDFEFSSGKANLGAAFMNADDDGKYYTVDGSYEFDVHFLGFHHPTIATSFVQQISGPGQDGDSQVWQIGAHVDVGPRDKWYGGELAADIAWFDLEDGPEPDEDITLSFRPNFWKRRLAIGYVDRREFRRIRAFEMSFILNGNVSTEKESRPETPMTKVKR